MIVVEQLNHAQWHVLFPHDRASGATNYVDALAYALVVSAAEGWGVETLDYDWNRLTLVHEEARHG
jgi:hypothetical protein